MRILFVTNNYTPYSGGLVSSIVATVKALQVAGHMVMLVAPDFLGSAHDDPEWVRRIPSLFRLSYNKKYIAFPWRSKSYIRNCIASFKPDVVHVHHPFLLGPQAVAAAKEKGIKTVFTYHTMYEAYAHYVPLPQIITQPLITKKVIRFCKEVDQIIAPSSTIAHHLKAQGISYVTSIASGLKEQFVNRSFERKTVKKPYQLLYVGRFVSEKNIMALFDVMAQLPEAYELTLVGYGNYLDLLQERAYDILGLSRERVRFIVQPTQQTLLDRYRSAHLFLFPSRTDTQGLVIAEAMACSTPVIAFDGPGQRDSIIDGKNGFIVANQREMAQQIQSVLSDPYLYELLQKNAWQSAQAFDPTHLVQQLIMLYRSVLS